MGDYGVDKILESEKMVYSYPLMVAGTLDRIVQCGRNVVLLDIKSGSTLFPATAIQTAAYANLYDGRYRIKKRIGVLLGPDGYKIKVYDDKNDYRVFLSCLQIHRFKQLHKIN